MTLDLLYHPWHRGMKNMRLIVLYKREVVQLTFSTICINYNLHENNNQENLADINNVHTDTHCITELVDSLCRDGASVHIT